MFTIPESRNFAIGRVLILRESPDADPKVRNVQSEPTRERFYSKNPFHDKNMSSLFKHALQVDLRNRSNQKCRLHEFLNANKRPSVPKLQ